MFVRNAWYAVGWGHEFGPGPVRRVVVGEPLALFRLSDGSLAALADRCSHRRYPLSEGRRVGDCLQCGYHGLEFDRDGTCVKVPGQDRVPSRAAVRSYPVREVDGWVWAWPGDPGEADPSLIPDHHWTGDPGFTTVGGTERISANYRLLIDNFLDLSHETFLHAGTIGNEAVAATRLTSERDGRVIRSRRHMLDVEIPPLYVETCGVERGDRWQDTELTVPNLFVLHVRIAPAGAPEDVGARFKVIYAITPESEDSTLEVWAKSRDFALEDETTSASLKAGVEQIIEEDRQALELQHANARNDPIDFECSVAADSAALHARRALDELLDAERAGPTGPVVARAGTP